MTDDELVEDLLAHTTDSVENLFWRIKGRLTGHGVADATVALAMVLAWMRRDAGDDADPLLNSLLAFMRRIEAARFEVERLLP